MMQGDLVETGGDSAGVSIGPMDLVPSLHELPGEVPTVLTEGSRDQGTLLA